MNAAEHQAQLCDSRAALLAAMEGIDEGKLRTRPGPGEWCVIEVLAHMVDVDNEYLAQALKTVEEPGRQFTYFDDVTWKAEHQDLHLLHLEDVLRDLARSHERVVAMARRLSQEALDSPARHPRGIPYTTGDILLRLATHDRNHTAQIIAMLAAVGAQHS